MNACWRKDEFRESTNKIWGYHHSAISLTSAAVSYLHDTLGHSRSSSPKFIGFSFHKTEWYFSHKYQRITSVWKYKFKAQILQIFVVTPKKITSNVKKKKKKGLLHLHFSAGSKYYWIVFQKLPQSLTIVLFFSHLCVCLGFFIIKFPFWIIVIFTVFLFSIENQSLSKSCF